MNMTDKNVVAETIQTYEETAEDYYKTHFDVNYHEFRLRAQLVASRAGTWPNQRN